MAPKSNKRPHMSSASSSSTSSTSKAPKRARMSGSPTSTTPSISSSPHQDKHSVYTKWAQDRGITITSVGPRTLQNRGTGLLATGPISTSDRLILVPSECMISTPAATLKRYKLMAASPQAQLAAHLTIAAQSWPRPEWYVNSRAVWPTPEDFKACMLAWSSKSELEVLKKWVPPGVAKPLERLLLDLDKDGKTVRHLCGEDDVKAQEAWTEEWIYHWILVNTRSFHWKPHGVCEGSMVMCPFLDYMNHCPNGQGCTVTVSTQGYELNANRDYTEGEEILATYGAHPNDKLLVHYGFILPDSPDDEIRLDHVILPRLNASQRSILQDVGYLGGYALDPGANELCFKTQVAVRSVLLTANEWEHYMGSGEDLASDKDTEVIEWLRPALETYAQQADAAVEKLIALRKDESNLASFESKLALLQARWEQVQEALERFLDPPIDT